MVFFTGYQNHYRPITAYRIRSRSQDIRITGNLESNLYSDRRGIGYIFTVTTSLVRGSQSVNIERGTCGPFYCRTNSVGWKKCIVTVWNRVCKLMQRNCRTQSITTLIETKAFDLG